MKQPFPTRSSSRGPDKFWSFLNIINCQAMCPIMSMTWFLVVVSSWLIVPVLAEIVVCPGLKKGVCILSILLIVVPLLLAAIAVLVWACIKHCNLGCEEGSDGDDDSSDNDFAHSRVLVAVCSKNREKREHNSTLEMRELHRIPFDGVRDFRFDTRSGAYVDVNYESYLMRSGSDPSIYGRGCSDVHGEPRTNVVNSRLKEYASEDSGQAPRYGEYAESETEPQSSWGENIDRAPDGEDQFDVPSSCERSSSRPKSFTPTLRSIGEELDETVSDAEVPGSSRPLGLVAAPKEIFISVKDLSVTHLYV